MTFVDADGFESAPSVDTFSFSVGQDEASVELTALPQVQANTDYVSRRLYRAPDPGTGTPQFNLIVELDASSSTYLDNGSQTDGLLDLTRQGIRGRLDGSLVVDPGLVIQAERCPDRTRPRHSAFGRRLGQQPGRLSSILR